MLTISQCPVVFPKTFAGPKVVINSKSIAEIQRQMYFNVRLKNPSTIMIADRESGLASLKAREGKDKNHQDVIDEVFKKHKRLVSRVLNVVEGGGLL